MKTRHTLKPVYVCVLLVLSAQAVLANPLNPTVVNGQASFATTGNALTVTNTPGTIINWQGFSIGAREITRFNQQSAASAVLNRVISNNPSSILGALQSNGRVFLVNPNGIVFGAGATVDVAGLVASSLNLSNADFLAGRYNFTQVPGAANISNAGNITAQTGGQIFLIAANVENTGVITAPNGEILLAAGHSVDLVNTSNPNLRVNITAPAGDATNVGQLIASAGSLGLFGTIVRNSGQVSADSATMQGGKIVFKAIQRTEVAGTVTSNGNTGGTIQALGNQVGVMDGATVTANGTQGGGTVLIGGDYQGKNPDVPNAQITYVAPTASISADGGVASPSGGGFGWGNGGKIIVWADDTTRAYGSLSARGGALSGNGGFIETSGKQYLDVAGIRVSTIAMSGTVGNWLLDPTDITIVHGIATGGAAFPGTTFNNGGGLTATLNDFDINTNLASSSITIATSSAALGAGDIKFDASGGAVAINGAGTSLNLQADRDIKFTGGSTTFSGAMGVVLSPTGKITTAADSSVTLDGNLGPTRGYVALVKTWENYGTLSLTNDAALHIEHNYGAGASTFHNMNGGIVNVAAAPSGWAIWSNGCCQNGILINDGTFNVTAGTSFEAAYSQSSTGTLNITNGQFLNLQNAIALSGGINLNATGALNINENHGTAVSLTNLTFSGAGGTLSIKATKTANMSNVSASNAALTVASGGMINVVNGDAVFKTVSLSGGGKIGAMTNGTLGIASGNFSIPNGVTYMGNVAYLAYGGLTVNNSISTNGTLTLVAGWDGTSPLNNPVVANPGSIVGTGVLQTPGTLSVSAYGGINLTGANQVGTFVATNAGSGNIYFNNGGDFNLGTVTNSATSGGITIIGDNSITQTGNLTTSVGAILVTANTNLTMGSATKAQSNGGFISYEATNGSAQLGLLDAGAGSVYVVAGENITDGNGASTNNIKAGVASLVASKADSGPGSIDVDTQVQSLVVDNNYVYSTAGQPNNPVTVRNSGSPVSVSVSSASNTGQLTITNNDTINVVHIDGATNTTLTATGASSDITVAAVGTLLSTGNIVLNAGRDILVTNDYVDAGGTVTATAGRDIRLASSFMPAYILAANGIDLTMQTGGLYIDGTASSSAYVQTTSGNINVATSTGFANGSLSGYGNTGALSAPLGRWLVWAPDPSMVVSGVLVYDFKQYNTAFGGSVLGTGNGFIYTIAPTVTFGLTGTVSKVYDGTNTASLVAGNSLAPVGAIDGDIVNVPVSATGSYDTPNAGAGKTVTASGATAAANGGAAVYGYQYSASGAVGTINPAALSVAANAASKTYDGLAYNGGNGVVYSGLVNGETNAVLGGALAYGGTSQGAISAGSYLIAPSGLTSGNYTISYVDGALTVNPAPATAPVAPQPVLSSLVSMSIPAINIPFNPPVPPVLMQAPTIDEINLLGPTAAGSDNPDDQAAQDAAAAGTVSVTMAEAAPVTPLPVCR